MLITGRHLNNQKLGKAYVNCTYKRAGVILYTIKNGKLWFLLGIDRRSSDFTDFGGGCKNSETLVECALREFNEETSGLLRDVISKNSLEHSIAITNDNKTVAIFFVWISPDHASINNIEGQFYLSVYSTYNSENSAVKWISGERFFKIAFNRQCKALWTKIQRFLMDNVVQEKLYNYLFLFNELCLKIEKLTCSMILNGQFDAVKVVTATA